MTRPLKVYGWRGWRSACPPAPNGGRQTREIVAAPSIAAALRAAGDAGPSREEICSTGNAEEIATAMQEPGIVFWIPLDARKPHSWVRVGERPA